MKSYHIDVIMKFDVPASSRQEAVDTIKDGFKEGRYVPDNREITVDGFIGAGKE